MAATTGGPKDRFGTKRLSIKSRCSQSAPACWQRRVSSPNWEKSLARMEGANRVAIGSVLHVLDELTVLVHFDPHSAGSTPCLDRMVYALPAAVQLVYLLVAAAVIRHNDPQPALTAAGLDPGGHVKRAVA